VSFPVLTPERRTLDRLRLRLQAALQRARLDAALAEGADPDDDRALALRAHQLTAQSTRHALARSLHNILDAAEEAPEAWDPPGPRPPLQRDAILTSQDDILAVADRLRHPISPQAAALAALLVWDSASPLYTSRPDTTITEWIHSIFDLLPLL
jgi:hypothetical protein